MPIKVFSDALEGMEIAVPPSSGNTEQETDEYGRSRDSITRRPLPPMSPPKVPPRSIARKPVASQPRASTRDTTDERQQRSHSTASFKPLPPEPREVRYRSTSRGHLTTNRPTGHRSSQKVSRLVGAEVNIFTESPAIKSAPICSTRASSSSLYSTDEQWNSSGESTWEDAAPEGGNRQSDAETTHQYHRILGSTRDDDETSPSTRRSCTSQYTSQTESRRFHQGQLDPRSRHVYERPRNQQPTPRVSPGRERPTSAFDSDSDDSKVSSVWSEIRKLVRPRSDV